MKTKTITLYEYSELSPGAKEKAYSKWRESEDDPLMQSHMINVLKEKLDERDIEYDADSIDVRYSLSNCQGDGFMFIGKIIWEGEQITITHNDSHYYHMYTAHFETGDLRSEHADNLKEMYTTVCKEMERVGYDHIEYATSEESFIEECEANEWTFREDGTMESTSDEKTHCPLCLDGMLEHEEVEGTQVYICDTCPAVVVEWWNTTDTKNLADRLDNPKKYVKS